MLNGSEWYGMLVDVGDIVAAAGSVEDDDECECGGSGCEALYMENEAASDDFACAQSGRCLPAGRRRISGFNCLDEE
jgi:hypothetical protein